MGTPEVGTHAIEKRLNAIEARAAALSGGGGAPGVPLTEEQERSVGVIMDGTLGNYYLQGSPTPGGAANTPLATDFSIGLEAANFLVAYLLDTAAHSMEDITGNATVTGTDEIEFDIDTTGKVPLVVMWVGPS